jgi:hypothetical protein
MEREQSGLNRPQRQVKTVKAMQLYMLYVYSPVCYEYYNMQVVLGTPCRKTE